MFQSPTGPYSVLRVSVPDVFSVKGGMGYTIWPKYGATATLGGRFDGIPIKDLFGAGPRIPAAGDSIGFVDPSISITRGDSTFQVDLPVLGFYKFRGASPTFSSGGPAPAIR